MSASRSITKLLAGAAFAAVLATSASAQEVTLRFHSFIHAQSNQQVKFFEPWCAKIKEQSQGRMVCQIFPAMQLGGSPAEIMDQAKDGIVDIAYGQPGYSPGKYLTAEMFELPFMIKEPHAASRALYDFLSSNPSEEFKGLKMIATAFADYVMIQTTTKPVKTMEDMKGLKIRTSSRVAGKAIEAVGALPVQLPGNAITESLMRGVIDGALLPWSGVRLLKLGEVIKHYTDIEESQPKISFAPNIVVMSEASYNKLPDDLKKVIDANSGGDASSDFTDAFDSTRLEDKDIITKANGDIFVLPQTEYQKWVDATLHIKDGWLADAKAKGLDGDALLAKATELLNKYQK